MPILTLVHPLDNVAAEHRAVAPGTPPDHE
jgi:hypothetical protein